MKLKFKIRVKDLVQSRQLQKDIYFEAGKTYDISDKDRVMLIVNRGWGEIEKAEIKKEVKVEMTEGTGDSSPAPRGRKPKVE